MHELSESDLMPGRVSIEASRRSRGSEWSAVGASTSIPIERRIFYEPTPTTASLLRGKKHQWGISRQKSEEFLKETTERLRTELQCWGIEPLLKPG